MHFVLKNNDALYKSRSTERHVAYPTKDLAVGTVPALAGWLPDLIAQKLLPEFEERFALAPARLKVEDLFVAKYEFVSRNDEFCIKHEELCIKNEEICIKNDEFCRVAPVGRRDWTSTRTDRHGHSWSH